MKRIAQLANKIFLPGTEKQISLFSDSVKSDNKIVLVIGAGSEEIAKIFHKTNSEVYLIVNDEDALVQSRFALSEEKEIKIRMMDYDNTDFKAEMFDIIYSQGSTGTKNRNKIVKEMKKLLKPEGFLCVGEIVSLTENPPRFVKDIWKNGNLSPLHQDEFSKFYQTKEFEIVRDEDLTNTLKQFYTQTKKLLSKSSDDLPKEELKSIKKLVKSYSHEANAYLKLGGDKFIGYRMLILKKISNLKFQNRFEI